MERKEKDLDKIFYSKDFVAGSLPKFWEKVKGAKLPYTWREVKDYYDEQELVQRFRPYTKLKNIKEPNKLITDEPFKRVWIDTMYFGKFKFAIVTGVDLFTKVGFVKPFYWKRIKTSDGEFKGITADEGLKAVKEMIADIEKMGYKIGTLTHDRGSEFKGELADYLESQGIRQKLTDAGDHRQNAPIERFNGTMRRMIEKYNLIYGGDMFKEVRNVIKAYNNRIHKTIQMAPSEVIGNEKAIKKIRAIFAMNQKGGESVQKIEDKARVRVLTVDEDGKFNKIGANFSKEIYTVESFDKVANKYKVSDGKKYRENQLLVVDKVRKYERPRQEVAREVAEGVATRTRAQTLAKVVQAIENRRQTRGKEIDFKKLARGD